MLKNFKQKPNINMRGSTLFLLVIFATAAAPCLAFFLQFKYKVMYGLEFSIFILFHSLFRSWETFFTSKENRRFTVTRDWTLLFAMVVYTAFCFGCILEFYLSSKNINLLKFFMGTTIYIFSYRLRWWGMKALGQQWAIHAIGNKRVKRIRLLKIGPYKYLRHPIYVGTLLEQLGLLLISDARLSFIFFSFFCIPTYFYRMKLEEKNNMNKFGNQYKKYSREVGMFFPRFNLVPKK